MGKKCRFICTVLCEEEGEFGNLKKSYYICVHTKHCFYGKKYAELLYTRYFY